MEPGSNFRQRRSESLNQTGRHSSFATWVNLCKPTSLKVHLFLKEIAPSLNLAVSSPKKWHSGDRPMPQDYWRKLLELDQPEEARLYAKARADGIPEEILGPPKVTAEQREALEKAALMAHKLGLPTAEAEKNLSRVDSSEANPFSVSYWPPEDPEEIAAFERADHEAQIAIGMAR